MTEVKRRSRKFVGTFPYDTKAYCGHCGRYVSKGELRDGSNGYPVHNIKGCGKKVRLAPRFSAKKGRS